MTNATRSTRGPMLSHGLTLLCLVLLSTGCAAPGPMGPTVRESSLVMPPRALLLATPAPVFSGSTNADLDAFVDDLHDALRSCNADKASIERALLPLTAQGGG